MKTQNGSFPGSAFDLAEVVESLTALGDIKELSFREKLMLDKAKKLLVCEISEVMSETGAPQRSR